MTNIIIYEGAKGPHNIFFICKFTPLTTLLHILCIRFKKSRVMQKINHLGEKYDIQYAFKSKRTPKNVIIYEVFRSKF